MTNIFSPLSATRGAVRITSQMHPFFPGLVISPAETALCARAGHETELLRLKAIARLHARGLPPDVGWEDLLQEAFSRYLGGSRRRPEGVSTTVFSRRRHAQFESRALAPVLQENREPLLCGPQELDVDSMQDPERALIAWQELNVVERLFADDALALKIVAGLAEGLSAEGFDAPMTFPK